jgi:hypothetical protein
MNRRRSKRLFTRALHAPHPVLTRVRKHPTMRRRLALVLFCVVLLAHAGVAAAASEDRGIVVRVLAGRLVIRELDGTRARFFVDSTTVVTLDGRRVRLRRLRPGDVATVDHVGRLATVIRALRP